MKHFFGLMALALVMTACFGGGGSGDGNTALNDKYKDVLSSCKNVITDDLVKNYNIQQSEFRIESAGYNMRCRAEVTENGRTATVERIGHPNIRIYPRMQFLNIDKTADKNTFVLHARVMPVTEDDIRNVLKSLGVEPDENHLQYDNFQDFPLYARFGKGSLYYLNVSSKMDTPQGLEVSFSVSADGNEESYLNKKLSDFTSNLNQIEVMWRMDQWFYRQIFSATDSTASAWSNVEGYDILTSYVYKSEMAGSEAVLQTAIKWAVWWELDGAKINATLPQLYSLADGQWLNPTFADNTVGSLVDSLNYLIKVNPNHSRKPVLDTYTRLEKYFNRQLEAMQTTMDYLAGKLWTAPQFNQILSMADTLYPKIGAASWKLSETILKRAAYDQNQANFLAGVAFNLLDRNMVSTKRDVDSILAKTFSKIQAGLTSGNTDFYFQVFDLLIKDYRSKPVNAEKTADHWVLTGRVTSGNFGVHSEFIEWLKNDMYVNYDDTIETVNDLIQKNPLDSHTVALFKKCLSWLQDDLNISRSNALNKAKDYFSTQDLTETLFTNLKTVVTWYTNDLYLNKTESLNRAENLVFKGNITQQQIKLLKDLINWMVNDLYVSKSNAIDRGESYIMSPSNPLTTDSFKHFKDLVNWLVNDLYQTKPDSLQKAEKLIFENNLKSAQTTLFKQAANWLIDDLYISKSEALNKSELYILKGHMTPDSFQGLKAEYDRQYNGHLSKAEALKKAENTVLGL